jgi:hypothetical protein
MHLLELMMRFENFITDDERWNRRIRVSFSSTQSFSIFFQSCIHLSLIFDISHYKRLRLWNFQCLFLRCWEVEYSCSCINSIVTENLNDLDTKVITRCLWLSSCSDKILLNVECEIVIWFDLLHDSCIHIMFIFFSKSYSRHDIIVFVDLAQLFCKNLIFWVVVSLIWRRTDHFFLIWFWLLWNARSLNCLMHVFCRSSHISTIYEDMILSICILNTYAFSCHDSLRNICILRLSLCMH